jgi:hypothetical protein
MNSNWADNITLRDCGTFTVQAWLAISCAIGIFKECFWLVTWLTN